MPRRIDVLSNLSSLRELSILSVKLNGRYNFMFSAFPMLLRINLHRVGKFKWKLEDLQSCPLLEEVDIWGSHFLTGDVASLCTLKNLEDLTLDTCPNVIGNILQLSSLLKLRELDFSGTSIEGSIESMADIKDGQFPALERLSLTNKNHTVDSIADASQAMNSAYRLRKKRGIVVDGFFSLSKDSSEFYSLHWNSSNTGLVHSPTNFHLVEAGCRLGWRWHNGASRGACEINWFDPEPSSTGEGYQKYLKAVNRLQSDVGIFRGITSPPTQDEFVQIAESYDRVEELEL